METSHPSEAERKKIRNGVAGGIKGFKVPTQLGERELSAHDFRCYCELPTNLHLETTGRRVVSVVRIHKREADLSIERKLSEH